MRIVNGKPVGGNREKRKNRNRGRRSRRIVSLALQTEARREEIAIFVEGRIR